MMLGDIRLLKERFSRFVKPHVTFELLHKRAVLPTLAHAEDVGYDLRCLDDVILRPLSVTRVKTGVAISECKSRFVRVFPKIEGRSGVALRGAFPVGGVIEPAYRGGIDVLMFSCEEIPLRAGDKVAQLVFYAFSKPARACVELESPRGAAGFGSSGA